MNKLFLFNNQCRIIPVGAKLFCSLVLIYFCLLCKITYADNVLVNIKFQFNNIATKREKPSPFRPGGDFKGAPDKVDEIYNKIKYNVNFQREIDISWSIVNYEFVEKNYDTGIQGYHLFDIIFHRLAMQYQRREGALWGSQWFSPVTPFVATKSSQATIKGFGQAPTISSFLQMPNKVSLWDIEKIIRDKNHRIIISRFPITQPFYISLPNDDLKGKKLEIVGDSKGANSCLYTMIAPFYYPFDRYGFDIYFKPYYPADVKIQINSSEDLDFTNYSLPHFSLSRLKKQEIHFEFFRDNKFRNIFWQIISALFPLLLLVFEKPSEKKIVRLLIYLAAFIPIKYIMPAPLNVPKYNLLYIVALIVFLGLVVFIELNFLKKKRPTKVSNGAQGPCAR